MYAIVNIKGKQYKVAEGQQIFVNRLTEGEGDSVEFGEVLLVDNEGAVNVGTPFVEGASVTAQVVSHVKDDKIIVFKKKRRKGYKVKNGHRQPLSRIKIESIGL
ncbi:UNVERIFIED_CONTAM: hypothetical protein GTU68_065464 [Idotea baltica]|nr:hypothetical protein [Idotea baltica]